MSQVTTGIRSILSSPKIYDAFQDLMGAKKVRLELVERYIRAERNMRILDIGCGTARILDYLPEVDYHGFDFSQTYINNAINRYGSRGKFNCALLDQTDINNLEPFDVVIATGLIHHLNDEQAIKLMKLANSALKLGGRFITNDPCFTENQNIISHILVSRDRGQNVRTPQEYCRLAELVFSDSSLNIKHSVFIPYTRCTMVCIK